ncbi:MAG: AAA family ATPase [Elusimicrobia bacterium]|nr:AAA family ATPase [Elusimicrobiota bacterium]
MTLNGILSRLALAAFLAALPGAREARSQTLGRVAPIGSGTGVSAAVGPALGGLSPAPNLSMTPAPANLALTPLAAPIALTPAAGLVPAATPAQDQPVAAKAALDGASKSADAAAAAFEGGAPENGAARAETSAPYRKREIAAARFGEDERQALIKQARSLKELVDRRIIGQDRATKIVQDRLVQYFEGFGSRTKDPIAAHLIGLPGIGKTAILDAIARLGFKVERLDVQKYVKGGGNASDYADDLREIADRNKDKPYILLIDEIDKLPEITATGEETTPFIGALNQILTDGFLSGEYATEVRFSNAMIITTMNFSPKEIEDFSASALKTSKKYYDFTIDDFQAFDAWIQKDSAARYKLLSSLFRANTVSRLAPNTVIMKPLSASDYAQIVKLTLDATIEKETTEDNAAKRLSVSYTKAFMEFLRRNAVFAPSGARETIAKVNALAEQLIHFGAKASREGDPSLAQPRLISLDFNPETERAEVTVTPRLSRSGKPAAGTAFTFSAQFDASAKLFAQPDGIASAPPDFPEQAEKEKRTTKKEVFAARFPKSRKLAAGLAEKINASLIGQEEHSRLVEKELNAYLNRPGPVASQPPFLVFAGFPGIGKSELANLAAKHLDLPAVRVNMQAFSSDAQDALANFGQTLAEGIAVARKEAKGGKFVVLFEELDKVFEVDQQGMVVNRPIMAAIKDLLQDGTASIPAKSDYGRDKVIDIRDAYNIITMNFRGDLFGFEADPRLTSIEDTRRAARTLAMTPSALKQVLGRMFLPETVSRLMPRAHIMNPLDAPDYRKLIALQADKVAKTRLTDKSRLAVEMTPAYRRYLFGETVIPSEGARNTVVVAQNRIASHLEEALARIPKSSRLATAPATIILDFKPGKSEIIATLAPRSGASRKKLELYRKEIALIFPPLAATGRLPVERIKTAVHEFGHAYAAVRLGLRFEYATAVPPKPGVGGYVKYAAQEQTARSVIARLYSALGSRAMERIFMSKDPRGDLSVLDVTPGPSNDILQATKLLWKAVYELGFDPRGGTIERFGAEGGSQYAFFSSLPPETVDKLGLILRRMENQLVADLLEAHDQNWYRDRIARFAKAGGLTESEFYEVIGYLHPGRNDAFLGADSRLAEIFAGQAERPLAEVSRARAFRQGRARTTAKQNLDAAVKAFTALLEAELHAKPARK